MKKIFYTLLLIGSLLFVSCKNDIEPTQFSEWLVGTWGLENFPSEYINFNRQDMFIMNDSIMGTYDIEDEEDKTIWYYWTNEDETNESDGYIEFFDVIAGKSAKVYGLPLHENDTIKIFHK